MKKKLIVSIILALVIVTVLAVCLSGCDSNNKKSAIVIEEYMGDEYNEIYAIIQGSGTSWLRVDYYRIYDNGVVVIETTYAKNYGEIQKTKFVTSLSQVTFQCSSNGRLM